MTAVEAYTIRISQCWYDDIATVDGTPTPIGKPVFLEAPVQAKILHEAEGFSVFQTDTNNTPYFLKLPKRCIT